jgi:integrase
MEAPMALYKPKYRNKDGELVEVEGWWYAFRYRGQQIRESSGTKLKMAARAAELARHRELEQAFAGTVPEDRYRRLRPATEMVDEYIKKFRLEHRGHTASIESVEGRLKQVKRLLGAKRLPDLTEDAMRDYVNERLDRDGVSGRTCNMEIGELSRAIGRPWSQQWPGLRPQHERTDVGRALSREDKQRLLEASSKRPGWRTLATVIRIPLLSGMRVGEALKMTWG